MAGIYLHIPFCKQACHYCDFHFSTSLRNKPEMIQALTKELVLRKNYLPEDTIYDTIYFGGGTPSILDAEDLDSLFSIIYKHYKIAAHPEITLEANPDDLSVQKLKVLKSFPINRLSIGIQSFFEEDLRWMNRAHSAKEAKEVLSNALDAGFDDLTADLIYGFPLLSDDKWDFNINQILDSGIRHFSAYNITVEKGTPLDRLIQKKQFLPIDDEQGTKQFLYLLNKTENAGWEQYEISNYCTNKNYSRHNTSYWQGIPYVGIGPSAHSFDLKSRQWNIRINNRYMESLQKGEVDFQKEILTETNHFNEYIMTGLRTMWGLDLERINTNYPDTFSKHLSKAILPFIKDGLLIQENQHIVLSQKGKLFADYISSELFF